MRQGMFTAAAPVLLGAALAALPGSAEAGYYVSSYASVNQAANGNGAVYSYNDGTHTGAFSSTSCTNSPDCVASGSGSTDTTGTLTSSNDQASYSATLTNRFNDMSAQSGSASSYANLAAGKIGAYGKGTYLDFYGTGGQDGVNTQSNAAIGDVLHFTVPGSGAATTNQVTVSFAIDGFVSSPVPHGPEGIDSGFSLDFGTAHFRQDVVTDYSTSSSFNNTTGVTLTPGTATGWTSTSYASDTPGNIDFIGVYSFTGPTADISITAAVNASCGSGVTCDYSHTGALSLLLPSGGSFTSDSGVFLDATSVPEPASLALLASGLAVATGVRRRRA